MSPDEHDNIPDNALDPSSPAEAPPADARRRHNLCARQLYLTPESRETYHRFRHATIAELDPQDHSELFIVEQIVTHRWFLLLADNAEAAAIRGKFCADLDKTRSLQPPPGEDPLEFNLVQADRALSRALSSRQTGLILRYRTAHDRALERAERLLRMYRTLKDAQDLRDNRTNFSISPAAFRRAHREPDPDQDKPP